MSNWTEKLRQLAELVARAEATGIRYVTPGGRIKWDITPLEYIAATRQFLAAPAPVVERMRHLTSGCLPPDWGVDHAE